jgi:xanthine dehydrogenase molybdopterin-binding subunit B
MKEPWAHGQDLTLLHPSFLPPLPVAVQIVEHVASALAKDSAEVKAENFLAEMTNTTTSSSSSSPSCDVRSAAAAAAGVGHGVVTALGRVLAPECYTLPRLWRELLVSSSYQQRLAAVREHNERHAWSKRGIAVTPVRWVGELWGGGGGPPAA